MINNVILTLTPVIARIVYHIPLRSLGVIEALVLLFVIISMFTINLIYSKKIFIISLISLSVSLFLLSMGSLEFFLSLVIAGLSFGVSIPTMTTIASSLAEKYSINAKLLKMYTLGLSLGAVISSILESIVTSLGVINLLLISLSLFNVYNIYLYFRYYPNSHHKKFEFLLKVILNRKLWIANMVSFPYDVTTGFFNVYLVMFAYYYYRVSISLGFLYFFTFLLISSLSRYFIYKYNINEEKMKLYGIVLTIIGSIILIIKNPLLLFISVAILGIPHGFLLPLSNLVIVEEFKEPKEKNFANSINLLFHYAVFIIVPLISGIFIGISLVYGLLAFIILSVISSLLLFWIKLK
ncbi:hypothetical protein [Acidianus sp. HS-5]|uniref:hypothetical protein n=1 Tax=Acidianus sp. HS-5 TaxID=2886040 RepID=UPI001F34ECEE|nr:hypothetical protein [Acidianus sp. HS-5]BDC19836.1 MFS transporter [Acidianus sp. HS-5]